METEEKRDETHVEQHGDGDVKIEQPESGESGSGEERGDDEGSTSEDE